MAQNTSLEGLRSQILTQIWGRRLGLDSNNYLVGPLSQRTAVQGVSSAGSTVTSTSVASPLTPYGVSLVGATAASATTGYTLSAPVPGVSKILFVPTTGYAVVTVTTDSTGAGAGAFICSTASVTSTYQIITFSGKGNYCELIGLTTALWGVKSFSGISAAALSSASSTSITVTNSVTFS